MMPNAKSRTNGDSFPTPLVAREPAPSAAVTRIGAILDFVTSQSSPVTLGQIHSGVAVPRSSLHVLCRSLALEGFLERTPDGRFTGGVRLVRLASRQLQNLDLARAFITVVDGEPPVAHTIQLAVLHGADVIYLARKDGTANLSLPSITGRSLPASTTAVGKAMLATLSDDAVRALFVDDRLLVPLTDRSHRTLATLLADLAEIRTRGYAIDDGETQTGILGIAAAAAYLASPTAPAGVSIATVAAGISRQDREALGGTAMLICNEIASRLGAPV
jgi:IclR family transcriptional regulator, blcABC operon repressor